MVNFSITELPEVFVSDTSISRAVSAAAARGELRKLGSRLYTKNLDEDPQSLVQRHWYSLLSAYFPDALITDRTAIENQPAQDGSVFLISAKTREVALPGLTFRPRTGPPPLPSDQPFMSVRLASTARAWLENMRASRSRAGKAARTLSPAEREARLDTMLRIQGEDALNRLRDDARALAPELGLEQEADQLAGLIGTLLGTRNAPVTTAAGKARAAGRPFDPERIKLFEALFAALRDHMSTDRPAPRRAAIDNSNLSFFEAYFSNFIEGTQFAVQEAIDIVFHGAIPADRPQDAHDVLGTFRACSDQDDMRHPPGNNDEFIQMLKARHAIFMAERTDKRPGEFKLKPNHVGTRQFVLPDLVIGTLERGYEFLNALEPPFCRAVFMMFLISEVHPFTDGNGRAARLMTNAQLAIGDHERLIIPIVYRDNYLSALRALTQNANPIPLIRMLDYVQAYTHAIDWSDLDNATTTLERTHAFADPEEARLIMPDQVPTT